MAVFRHLGFVGRVLGRPAMTTWSLSLRKIWLKSMEQFLQYEIFNILPVWLVNAYSLPKNWGFGGFQPQNG